jgi:hypothetical protein
LKQLRNCEGSGQSHYRDTFGGMIVNQCPVKLIDRATLNVFKHYGRYREHGLLPRPGGTFDQDARLMQAFDTLDGELSISRSTDDDR